MTTGVRRLGSGISIMLLAAAVPGGVVAQEVMPPPPPPLPAAADASEKFQTLASGQFRDLVADPAPAPQISLRAAGERLWLHVVEGEGRQYDVEINLWLALAFLSDRRVSFLWEPLMQRAGEDLGRIRDAQVASTRQALAQLHPDLRRRSSNETAITNHATLVIRHARALADAGRHTEAAALIRTNLPANLRRQRDQMDFSVLSSALARVVRQSGDENGAIALLVASGERMGRSPYRSNLDVNRADYLVKAGRFAEALQLIDSLLALTGRSRGDPVEGSDRHFNFIRACALHGLGRVAEARALAATVAGAGEPFDPRLITEPGDSVRSRMYLCMNDAQGIIAELHQAIAARNYARLWPYFQDGFPSVTASPELIAAVRADPRIQAAASAWLRPLPETLLPAMRQWRPAGQD